MSNKDRLLDKMSNKDRLLDIVSNKNFLLDTEFSFPNTLTEQASLQSYKCSSRTRMLDTQLIFRDKIVWLISVMESGLNLDTAIRRGN